MQFFYHRTVHLATILLVSVALAACGGGEKEARNQAAQDAPASSAQQSAANNADAGVADTTINVVARDFEFSLDSNRAAAGTISFVLTNEGSMPHDFAITINGERHKTEMLNPGESGSVTVELPAGSYEYICSVPGHDILGMKGTFTVE